MRRKLAQIHLTIESTRVSFIISNLINFKRVSAFHGSDVLLEELKNEVKELEHRLSSIEQPLWLVTKGGEDAWSMCSRGMRCRCLSVTRSLNCWNHRLISVPASQTIPMDITNIDLSSNFLTTFHKSTFRGLSLVSSLDLSTNLLNYLPSDIFYDLENLVNL